MKVLHIGYPKTGTTFLQSRLFGPLAISGVIPSYIGDDGMSRKHVTDPAWWALIRIGRGDISAHQRALLNNFVSDHPSFLISVEGILGKSADLDLVQYSQRLASIFDSDTEILISVRSWDTYFSSLYQEMVKEDFVSGPEDAFFPAGDPKAGPARKSFYTNFAQFNLDELVAALSKDFKKVTIIDAKLPGYLIWLADQTGVSVSQLEELIQLKANSKIGKNESLSKELVRLVEIVNRILRMILRVFGIRGFVHRLTDEEIGNLTPKERMQSFMISVAKFIKVWVKRIARKLNYLGPKRSKYQLPIEINERILSMIPESKLLVQVREAGGVLTIQDRGV
jgi:hypothetical protein